MKYAYKLSNYDFCAWGGAVDYCEGARLYWDDKFFRAEILRVNN
jgi:hypothetical protein